MTTTGPIGNRTATAAPTAPAPRSTPAFEPDTMTYMSLELQPHVKVREHSPGRFFLEIPVARIPDQQMKMLKEMFPHLWEHAYEQIQTLLSKEALLSAVVQEGVNPR